MVFRWRNLRTSRGTVEAQETAMFQCFAHYPGPECAANVLLGARGSLKLVLYDAVGGNKATLVSQHQQSKQYFYSI